MGLDDKMRNAAEHAKGQAKEGAGSATGDSSLEREGKIDQLKADAKDLGEKAKDAAKDVFDK